MSSSEYYCWSPLGMEDGTILKSQITQSSGNKHFIGLNSFSSWNSNKYHPWIEIDLKTPKTLTGILIQGKSSEWVTSLQIKTGNDTAALQYITEDNGDPTVNSIGREIKYNII